MTQQSTILILHELRSCHNVGSIFRSADAFGIDQIICSGITPYPKLAEDKRLPHVAERAHHQIAKTALGAEESLAFSVEPAEVAIGRLQKAGYTIYAVEQAPTSKLLAKVKFAELTVLVMGAETVGLDEGILKLCDEIVEIPMLGMKESLNVSVAAAVAMYERARQISRR